MLIPKLLVLILFCLCVDSFEPGQSYVLGNGTVLFPTAIEYQNCDFYLNVTMDWPDEGQDLLDECQITMRECNERCKADNGTYLEESPCLIECASNGLFPGSIEEAAKLNISEYVAPPTTTTVEPTTTTELTTTSNYGSMNETLPSNVDSQLPNIAHGISSFFMSKDSVYLALLLYIITVFVLTYNHD